jgi:hypothetical protein
LQLRNGINTLEKQELEGKSRLLVGASVEGFYFYSRLLSFFPSILKRLSDAADAI